MKDTEDWRLLPCAVCTHSKARHELLESKLCTYQKTDGKLCKCTPFVPTWEKNRNYDYVAASSANALLGK